jgi:hypothetical protein
VNSEGGCILDTDDSKVLAAVNSLRGEEVDVQQSKFTLQVLIDNSTSTVGQKMPRSFIKTSLVKSSALVKLYGTDRYWCLLKYFNAFMVIIVSRSQCCGSVSVGFIVYYTSC